MAKQKFDGVVQAAHYNPDGQVAWVRVYLRRGATFSDRLMLDRNALIAQIKAGKRFFTGERVPQMAGTFITAELLRLVDKKGQPILVAGSGDPDHDQLAGAPII
jgi:hypothetical protein